MKRTLLILAISVPFLLTACNQNDEATSAETSNTSSTSITTLAKSKLFEFVPADTPYLFANIEGMPADVTEAYLKNSLPMYIGLRDSLAKLEVDSQQTNADTPTSDVDNSEVDNDSNSHHHASFAHFAFINSILSDFIEHPGIEGIEKMGFSANSKSVIYGLGLFPVARMEIGDEARLRATLNKAFTAAGNIPEEKTLNGRKYWQAGDEKFQLITSINASELVISIIPTSMATAALPNILAQIKPANPLDINKSLSTLNKNNDYTNYGSGWMDTQKLLDLFLNSDSSAATTMRQMIEFDAQSVSQVCRDEYNAIGANFPRMHAGYHSLSPTEVKASFTLELKQTIANDLQSLVIADALSTTASGGLLNLGFALNFAKAREWLLESAGKRVENPYKCDQLQGMNQAYTQAYEGLNRPLPPFVGNLTGFKVFIDELDLDQFAQGNPVPQKIKAMFALLTSNPEMLVGMGQMFMPELASLDLSPGTEPVALTLDGIPKPDEPMWAASSKSAIGVAAGEGMDSKLLAFLSNGDSKDGEFIIAGIDGELQSKIEATTTALMEEIHPSQGSPKAPLSTFERAYFSASFTSNGIVFKQTTQLKK